jgi:ABC-type antimicrobial peptide transport system permease subunit
MPGSPIVDRSVFFVRDLLAEAIAGITSRPSRTALTALGTVLGVAALVATLGLARTAGNRIVSRFDELSATEVVVTPANQGGFGGQTRSSSIPWDAQDRLERLNGVAAAGTKSDVELGGALVRAVPVVDPTGATAFPIPGVATSGGLFDAVRAELATGTVFDEAHNDLSASVAVLGPAAAQRLSITRVDNQPAIFVGDIPIVVVGILADVQREPDLLNSIIITDGFARERFDLAAPAAVHVDTDIGGAQLIGGQAALALVPNNPELVRVRIPPDPASLRERVGEDINALFLLLGGISLLVGAIGIANVTLVSVLERTAEIGLRRSLGATKTHIATLFLTESAILGFIAGVVGTSIGVLTVVGVSAVNTWEPVLQPWLPLATPLLGLVIGVVSGAYPAWRAAAIEPITALRAGG